MGVSAKKYRGRIMKHNRKETISSMQCRQLIVSDDMTDKKTEAFKFLFEGLKGKVSEDIGNIKVCWYLKCQTK